MSNLSIQEIKVLLDMGLISINKSKLEALLQLLENKGNQSTWLSIQKSNLEYTFKYNLLVELLKNG